jgi:cytochrome c oxidase subunit 2
MSIRRAMMAATLLVALGSVVLSAGKPDEPVIQLTAKKWEFTPSKITLRQGVPVVLELRSLDRKHGFSAPELGIRVDITPDKPTRVRVVPTKVGIFTAHCDVFCGEGREEMVAEIVVVP